MTERRSSVSLRASTNAYSDSSGGGRHVRARSAERSQRHLLVEDDDSLLSPAASHDQDSDRDSDDSNEEFPDQHSTHTPPRNRLGSDASVCSTHLQTLNLRRANSDPFENAGLDDEFEEDEYVDELTEAKLAASMRASRKNRRASIMDEEDAALPTFNRFPFAETKNRNCWDEPPHSVFMIRGPNYLSDKQKIACQQFLMRARGCDLFLSDHPEKIDMAK